MDAARAARRSARPLSLSGVEEVRSAEEERAVVVRLGGTEFGINVRQVREVLRVPPITRLPFPPPTILGIVSIRGTLVPVMDLGARLLGHPGDRQGRLVVVRDPEGEGSIGLLVDEVLDLAPLEQAAHEPPPEVESSLPSGWILGVLSPEDSRLVTLLELTHVLDLKNPAAEERR
jgi:purine-binding chemotaxis protein CheW